MKAKDEEIQGNIQAIEKRKSSFGFLFLCLSALTYYYHYCFIIVKERLLLTEAAWKKSDQRNSELEKLVEEGRVDKEREARAMEVPFLFVFFLFFSPSWSFCVFLNIRIRTPTGARR